MKKNMLRLLSLCLTFAVILSVMAEGMGEDEFDRDWICPACGTLLNNQEGFSAGLDKWTCKVCNTLLEGDGDVTLGFDPEEGFKNARFPGIYWYCDNCGEFLNNQNGFHLFVSLSSFFSISSFFSSLRCWPFFPGSLIA